MADFNQPTPSTAYLTVLDNLKARDVDAYTLSESPTNPPTGAIRYNRSLNKFQEWDGAAWQDKVLSLAGGGTGGNDAVSARTSLGLGSIATQNSNAVNITGGTISGITALSVLGDGLIAGRLEILSTAVNALEVSGGIRAGSGNIDIVNTLGKIPEFGLNYFSTMTIPDAVNITNNLTMTGSLTADGNINSGTAFVVSGTFPQLLFNDSGGSVDEKIARIVSDGNVFKITLINDAFSSQIDALRITRVGNSPNSLLINTLLLLDNNLGTGGEINFAGGGAISSNATDMVLGVTGFVLTMNSSQFDVDGKFTVDLTNHDVEIPSLALGANVRGPSLRIGRNTTNIGCPSTIGLESDANGFFYLWVDSAGRLRIGPSRPTLTDGSGDLIGTVVGTQS